MRIWVGEYEPGKWKAECDRCGFDYKNDQLRKEWTGLMVCHGPGTNQCWEPRHPQDFVKGVPDPQAVPWTRQPSSEVILSDPIQDAAGAHVLDAAGNAILAASEEVTL